MNRLLFVMLIVSGCASPSLRSQWNGVLPGQSKDELVQAMGNPHEFSKDQGRDILVWHMDRFEKCAVLMSADGKVEEKHCKDDTDARAKAMAAFMQMQGMANSTRPPQSQPSFTPIQPYQMPRPIQTNCTTNSIGNTGYTNCSSQPTGIDSSIYK